MNNIDVFAIAVIAIFVMKRWGVETAILNVYLPVLMLIPTFYGMRIPHLPGINCQASALIPIVFVMLLTQVRAWQFRLSDFLVFLFAFEAGYSEYINTGFGNGLFDFMEHLEIVVLPYLLGRIMIEQPGFREKFVRRFVLLVVIVSAVSPFEFITGRNPFYIVGRRFFLETFTWANQMRYGFVRIKGPYAGSIHAGLAIMMAIMLLLWLRMIDRHRRSAPEPKRFGLRRSTWFLAALAMASVMTFSRGPWLGLAVGLVVAAVGRSKRLIRAAIIATVLCTIAGVIIQIQADQYLANDNDTTDAKQSAVYRKVAFKLYEPIAEKGGYFGWGITTFPRVKGMDSIDNEFLLLRVSQGKLGYWLFLLLFADATLAIIISTTRSAFRPDTFFYFCLGGAVAGMMATLGTVYLTGQTTVLLFMMYGWIQSLQRTPPPYDYMEPVKAPRYGFKRVFA
jgi:O-Antigen ligase